jgi:hypothetical protein
MPTSIDPQPEEHEIECARCGAYFYYELSRCPNCGVNIYEPEDELEDEFPSRSASAPTRKGNFLARLLAALKRLFGLSSLADELFEVALDQRALYEDLLRKVGGDAATVERLVHFERDRAPDAKRTIWLQNAIWRWERDNG